MFDLKEKGFAGPAGRSANFVFRSDSADENTVIATYSEDEYKFAEMPPQDGDFMIDAGGYVGSTAILYAQLFPTSKVICIEPLPENADIIRKNIERNGLSDRVILIQAALWGASGQKVKIYYRDASTVGSVHKFVGSGFKNYHETVSEDFAEAETISLADIITKYNIHRIRVLKMDLEGSEYETLKGLTPANLMTIQTIVGEYHNIDPQGVEKPRTKLFDMVKDFFDDRSYAPEVRTWGAFLFERKPLTTA